MTKELFVDPTVVRQSATIELGNITVNAPAPKVADVPDSPERLRALLRDMMLIREFETMLDGVKRQGNYLGIEYVHRGPAHLSIGQEAAAVGEASALDVVDHIYGSHRSHGEVIAKGMAAVDSMEPAELDAVMRTFRGGRPLDAIADRLEGLRVRDRARVFFLYGLLAEMFARDTGFNAGLSGSMHAFFPPFGIYPNNAIVGASAPIATGAALFNRVQRRPGLVVANIGDASTGCGPVWEAMNFASMGQFTQLFDAQHSGGLPVLFVFMNNFYGMGGQTIGETMGFERLARIGAGVNRHNMHAETVDGNDLLAVRAAVQRARAHLEAGEGPVLLDCQTYRYSGHSTSDPATYRTQEEVDRWRAIDPITVFADQLRAAGCLSEDEHKRMGERVRAAISTVLELARDPERSPVLGADGNIGRLGSMLFADTVIDLAEAPVAETVGDPSKSSRVQQLRAKSRAGVRDGKPLSGARAVTFREAIFESIVEHATRDGRLVIYGEENRDWDGAFGVYRGLTELLPYHRLFNAPISEAAIVGTAVGYAIEGGRALVELMYADFIGRAGDEIFNQLAKWRAMSGGLLELPVVLRVSVGARYGAQHSQDWTALPAHVPGLKVVYPATPYDAKGMMAEALSTNDPVVFFESQRSYDDVERYRPEVPTEYFRIPLGQPHVVRQGSDLTLLSIGPTLHRCMAVADHLAGAEGWQVEVIDARSLVPFDPTLVLESIARTGRLAIVTDACARGSVAGSLAQELQVLGFDDLDAPVVVVGAQNWVSPPLEMEDAFFPSADTIVEAVTGLVLPGSGTPAVAHARTRENRIAAMAQGR